MKHLQRASRLLPETPGVYLFRGRNNEVIYVGKAVNLRRRVSSYFVGTHDAKTSRLVADISSIEHQPTDSAIEALMLEAKLIKKYNPKYNIIAKDDRSYLYVWISREKYPKVELVRGTDIGKISEKNPRLFGPYLSSQSLRAALDIIRKIVPYRSCHILPKKKCLYGYLGLCAAPCVSAVSASEYQANVRELISFLNGNKKGVARTLTAQMKAASKNKEYERAALLRDKINSLNHIQDVAVLAKDDKPTIYDRIEGYDISNVSGQMATGSMVVFRYGQPEKSEYRKFRIKTVSGSNDTAMLAEVIKRRLRHDEWPLPDIMLIDGGKPQLNAVLRVLRCHSRIESEALRYREPNDGCRVATSPTPPNPPDSKSVEAGLPLISLSRVTPREGGEEGSRLRSNIPLVGIAKGPDRKKDEFIFAGNIGERNFQLFKQVRDEAHRFARGYYRLLHRNLISKVKYQKSK